MSGRQQRPANQGRRPSTGLEAPEATAAILALLSHGDIELKGRVRWSSNATFLVAVSPPGEKQPGTAPVPTALANELSPVKKASDGRTPSMAKPAPGTKIPPENNADCRPLLAIYKPAKGERPLWDFPRGLWKREVAAYQLASALGWDIVPPTVARGDGPFGPGSLQYCVDAVMEEHYFSLLEEPTYHGTLRCIAVFDLISNNADRKSGHCLLDQRGRIWAIDHGLCFHTEPKLRTVIWDFAGDKIDHELSACLEPLSRAEVPRSITSLLDDDEIDALAARAAAVLARGRFPEPSGNFPYPWPLV